MVFSAMVFPAQCSVLLGAGDAVFVTASRFSSSSSSSSSSPSAIPSRFVRIRVSSSSSSPSSSSAPVESSGDEATSSPDVKTPVSSEPESASISTLDIPPPAPTTSTSLVSRTAQLVSLEGSAGLAQVNHYRILKISFGASSDEIFRAYKDRVGEVKSREEELGQQAAAEQLLALKASYDILNSEEERKIYDWILQQYENRLSDSYIWPYETDVTQRYTNKEPPPVMRSFDQEGNNKLGLFLLVWVAISIVFSATMKTMTPYPHWKDL